MTHLPNISKVAPMRFQGLYNKVKKRKAVLLSIVLLVVLHYCGVFTFLFELNYETDFKYPLHRNITKYVEQLKKREFPDMLPINTYDFQFTYTCSNKCRGESVRVVYIIKSALENFDQRKVIRHTWGSEKRFSDVNIKRIFLLGSGESEKLNQQISDESKNHKDIVQANFIDHYYNNTYKTMMGFKWAMMYCKNAKFYFFSDDDMYVSTKNLLRFLHYPDNYPQYLEKPILALQADKLDNKRPKNNYKKPNINDLMDFELPEDVELYAGYVFQTSRPQRHFFSKWYISLEDYPYNLYPPYVTAGAYVVSRQALINIFYGSAYTINFRFDDIYLGIVAKKIGLDVFHCDEFYFYKKPYNAFSYRYVIASHGYKDPEELLKVWDEQKSIGNA